MKRKQLESLLSALIPTLRHFVERQIGAATTQLRSVIDQHIQALPKPKDGADGKSVTKDDVEPLIRECVDALVPKAEEVATLVAAQVELPAAPTAEEVAAVALRSMATGEQIAEMVRAKLTVPTAQEVAALIPAPEIPKPEDIAALVKMPAVPSAEEIAVIVRSQITVPTAQEVADLVPAAAVPTAEEIAAKVQLPTLPSADELVERVRSTITVPSLDEIAARVPAPVVELPEIPSVEQIVGKVLGSLPTAKEIAAIALESIRVPSAEEVAKLVELPTIEIPQLPELPHVPTLDEVVESLKAHIPAPIKGDKGDAGTVDMKAVEIIVSRFIESEFSKWALQFERRALDRVDAFLKAIEKPRDGIDGKDGYGFDDMSVELNADRILTIKFERADKPTKSFEFELPIVIYQGVYKDGQSYSRGDQVTWDGCSWIARAGTTEKPGQSDSWQLAVKKGRDGRDATDPEKKGPTRVRVAPRTSTEK